MNISEKKLCLFCGNVINQRERSVYCSDKCKRNHYNIKKKEKRFKKWKKKKIRCAFCNELIPDERWTKKYCSDKCKNAVYKPKKKYPEKKICPNCKNIFYAFVNRKYCSNECFIEARNSSKKNKRFEEWKKKKVRCAFCNELIPDERWKSTYCSNKCRFRSYRKKNAKKIYEKNKEYQNKHKNTRNKKRRENRFEKWKEQNLKCFLCGKPIPETRRRAKKFCCREHNLQFIKKQRNGEPIPIQIDGKSIIYTKKYDKIDEIRNKYKNAVNKFKGEVDFKEIF